MLLDAGVEGMEYSLDLLQAVGDISRKEAEPFRDITTDLLSSGKMRDLLKSRALFEVFIIILEKPWSSLIPRPSILGNSADKFCS